jgi:hypothetical protein
MKLDFLAMLCDGNMQLMQYESRDRILPPCSSRWEAGEGLPSDWIKPSTAQNASGSC